MQNISKNDDNNEFGSPGFDNNRRDQDPTLGVSNTAVTSWVSGALKKSSKQKEPGTNGPHSIVWQQKIEGFPL